METNELIEHLRIMGKHDDRDPNYYLLAADTIEAMMADRDHLLKACKAMHLWIFLHTGDEEAAYKECGLSDEDDARFGYAGSVMLEAKDHE